LGKLGSLSLSPCGSNRPVCYILPVSCNVTWQQGREFLQGTGLREWTLRVRGQFEGMTVAGGDAELDDPTFKNGGPCPK